MFCGLGSDFVEWHLFWICFLSLWWSRQSSSPKIVFMFCVLDTVEGESVMAFEGVNSDYSELTLIWIKKPSTIHALSTQLSSEKRHTFRHESDDGHSLLHVGWCDWPVTQNSRYWHHKIWNISCLNSHFLSQFMLKSLPARLHFCICLLLMSLNYFRLWKPAFTTSHRTTMMKCLDW